MSTDTQALAQPKQRMEWLDAMRGFTMILVVAHHICSISIGLQYKEMTSFPFLVLLRMPLFFFISGFLAYSVKRVWNAKATGRAILKKISIQLIPTLVFLSVFCIIRQKGHFFDVMQHDLLLPYKAGYWFTWTLLHMFIIYYIFAYFELRITRMLHYRIPQWLPIILLWIGAALWYESNYIPRWYKVPKGDFVNIMSFNQIGLYFCFFVTGNIVRRYWTRIQQLFDSGWFFVLLVIVCLFCSADFLKWHNLRMEWANLPRTLAIFSMIGITLMYFRSHAQFFSKQTRTGRVLQYIGTRTLDIYLIHYIFLPVLPVLRPFIRDFKPGIMPELFVSISLAIPVIALCLLVSSVLRTSPFLARYLFGVKPKTAKQ